MTRLLGALLGLLVLAGCGAPAPNVPSTSPLSPALTSPAATVVAEPTRIYVQSIGASSTLIRTGMLPDGSPEVPDVRRPGQASWATWSPRPGAIGPAVVYGHVNGGGQPGVFARLAQIRPGALVVIGRNGGPDAMFVVDRVATFPKADIPTREVYGDTTGPELRLITCGGTFDRAARSYRDQVVAFAHLIDRR